MSGAATKIPRSRQTVVCTECKRLKVKCDKLSPCSQCAKRSNDPRVCVYLTANTERPDINILWNNQREADLRIETLAIRVDEIHDSYLPRRITMPPLVIMASHMGSATLHPLDSVTALWATTLGIPTNRVDALITNGLLPPTSRLFDAQETSDLHTLFFSTEPAMSGSRRRRAVVTFALLQQLPSNMTCDTFITSLNSTLILHPICSSMHHLETRMRALYDPQHGLKLVTDIPVSFFAVAAAAMTLGSLTYQTERKAWKMQPEFPESEQDITKLFDLAKIAISLAGESEDDQNDVMLALLLLIVFTLHSREMDGYKAVVSGVAPMPIRQQLAQLIDTLRRKADMSGLLSEPPTVGGQQQPSLWSRESRRSLAAAVAFYDFLVSDLIGTKVTLDGSSYSTEAPAPVDGRYFKPTSVNLPSPSGNIYHSSTFATYRARLLKALLQARAEIVYLRDQEKALMIAAAEASANQATGEEDQTNNNKKVTQKSLPRTAGDLLEQWDERLHQLQENLPHVMSFDTSLEYAAEVAYVFSGEQKVPSSSEPSVTLAMGYGIAQQTELAALTAYYRMRFAALLLENAIIYKPRGSPPSANLTVAAVRVLDAAQALVQVLQVQRHVLKKKMPLCLSSYVYGKRIFDTGVLFAIVCTIPSSRVAERRAMQAAAEGLGQCIELLRDLETWLRVKEGLPEPTSPPTSIREWSPPLRVLEHLAERVGVKIGEAPGGGGGVVVESVDPKRKRGLVEFAEDGEEGGDAMWEGLILPYVMGGYAIGKAPPETKSWIGHQENVPTPTVAIAHRPPLPPPASVAVAVAVPAALPPPAVGEVKEDQHRDKRMCLPTPVEGIVMHDPSSGSLLDFTADAAERFANAIGRKRPSGAMANAAATTTMTTPPGMARPVSGTNPARPPIAVRARVKELKRPKRKAAPAGATTNTTATITTTTAMTLDGGSAPGAGDEMMIMKQKSASPMGDSADEDYADRFAFDVNREDNSKSEEYSVAQHQQMQLQMQNELALTLEMPEMTAAAAAASQSQQQPQQPQQQQQSSLPMSVVENKQLSALVDSSSSNDSPPTPHHANTVASAGAAGQSYVAEAWNEMETYGQSMLSSHGYSGNGLMLSQGNDAPSYAHPSMQQQQQQQQQHHQQQQHQQHQHQQAAAAAAAAQSYHHLAHPHHHQHHHVHASQAPHKVPISYIPQRQAMQEYSHPQMHAAHGHAHAHAPYPHAGGYGGYATTPAVDTRPHLVIDAMGMSQPTSAPGSQPPSAVAMGDPSSYYASSVAPTPIQTVPPPFGTQHSQHDYTQTWHASQGADYYGYN